MISNIKRLEKKGLYNFSIVLFFLMLFSICASLYVATAKIDYVWRWDRSLKYFAYNDLVEIEAEARGTAVVLPTDKGWNVEITGEDGKKAYFVPKKAELNILDGEYVYEEGVIGSYTEFKAGVLLRGLWITIKASAIATVFGIIIGLMCGIARLSSNPFFKWSAITYVEIIRGSPLLVQIFIWYFVFGTILNAMFTSYGFQIEAIWYGIAALAFFTGAYVGEIVRAGIQSINKGQTEAARSLGMNGYQCMRYIILPQALKRILPPLAGQFINLIKDSSLLGIIAIRELTKATREVITTSLQPFELWFICAIMYLVLTFSLSMALQYLERMSLIK
ncbi:MAG: amino acid ABC transporter permease [Deltaproteobacteria bacterium]|nr:amino acid ABC transporter permease [Deltaproteobacteria bacterium]